MTFQTSLKNHVDLLYNYLITLDRASHRYLITKHRLLDLMAKLPYYHFDFVIEPDPEPQHFEYKFDGVYKVFN